MPPFNPSQNNLPPFKSESNPLASTFEFVDVDGTEFTEMKDVGTTDYSILESRSGHDIRALADIFLSADDGSVFQTTTQYEESKDKNLSIVLGMNMEERISFVRIVFSKLLVGETNHHFFISVFKELERLGPEVLIVGINDILVHEDDKKSNLLAIVNMCIKDVNGMYKDTAHYDSGYYHFAKSVPSTLRLASLVYDVSVSLTEKAKEENSDI